MAGKPWDQWSMWTALQTYAILADKFGWAESYTPVIKQYYSMKEDINVDDRLDIWARKYMEQVKHDLCDYFTWWTWKLSKETLALCKKLPKLRRDLMKPYLPPNKSPKVEKKYRSLKVDNCPDGWYSYGKKCYIASMEKANWWEAEQQCHQMTANNGHLASCFSDAEAKFLAKIMSLYKSKYYIGMSDV